MINRKYFNNQQVSVPLPNLIEIQTHSYQWLFKEGMRELLDEISPVVDFTGKNMELYFGDYFLDAPKYNQETAQAKNLTYKSSLKCKATLVNKNTGRKKISDVYLGDFPLMTAGGTFIINGIERVVVSQIVRSYGVLFTAENFEGRKLFGAKLIPSRGTWLEMETNPKGVIYVKIDRRRKVPVTALLRVLGLHDNAQILAAFADADDNPDCKYIENTLKKDPASNHEESLIEVYKRVRPGDLATVESARSFLEAMFFNLKRYDLGKVGRYKINRRLNLDVENKLGNRILRLEDVIETVKEIIRLNNDPMAEPDDIDHLQNRRIRTVGELIQERVRVGFLRMERIIKDRMSVLDPDLATPAQLVNNRPIIAVLQEFFASSQLSQFMNQTNPLAELENKRYLSATGPGGLSRERAGFEVRDVHPSHYGRICPIETPEGPNIGLVGYLSTYAKVNEYGFIETPYYKVEKNKNGVFVTNKFEYLDAAQEDRSIIASASTEVSENGCIKEEKIVARRFGQPSLERRENIQYMDVSPKQIVSMTAALIPFIRNDDAVRASKGSNMERQAVPLFKCEAPIVGTGIEGEAARFSGRLMISDVNGTVKSVTGSEIIINVSGKQGVESAVKYPLEKFIRSNQGTCINQRPLVSVGDQVKKGQVLADGAATEQGELALGQNVLAAFMSFEGYNFEDAIIISERLAKQDLLTSIHIEEYSIEVRDTELGPELITRDIPNVGEEALANLDEEGIIRIGAEVSAGDILVGKISPKGETELTAEEKLLRAIFGEKAKDVKDSSLRLPHGERGKIVEINVFSKDKGDELPSGVYKMVEISVAQMRKIQVGDKLAGRHGNKGVIARIYREEDMPFLSNGQTVDIILNPLGVISRMNLGQILETYLGRAAKKLGYRAAIPAFENIDLSVIEGELKKAGFAADGKETVYDGRTGEPFKQRVVIGWKYIMKLIHLVEDKIHARSTGPYSMVTQQPLGGKAQFGGQRFGEMEVWALEAYGAAYSLQEILTIKSDDIIGRAKAYESIIREDSIQKPRIPASFFVLARELQSLGLNLEMISQGKGVSVGSQELAFEKAAGEARKKREAMEEKKIKEENLSEEERRDIEVTEILRGQEENPPEASESEKAPIE